MQRAVTKHNITGNFAGHIELEYDAKTGHLVYMGVAADLVGDRHAKFLSILPMHVSGLKELNKAPIVVTTISKIVTFEDFYKAYGYFVDRQVANDRWDKLSDKDKIEAYNAIPAYFAFCDRQRVAKKYPSTYLNNQKKSWTDFSK